MNMKIRITMMTMKLTKFMMAFLLLGSTFTACKKDKITEPEPEAPKIKVENLELGLNNSAIGIVGEDFHFEADILAVDKIDWVEIRISQKAGETYSSLWDHEIIWDEFEGVRNTNVHKHFMIPGDAPEGKYDFFVIVYDKNGDKLEIKKDFEIYTRANLPIRPTITQVYVHLNGNDIYDSHYDGDMVKVRLKKGDILKCRTFIDFVKGDGKLYMLLIKKSANYHPKTIEEVDLTKAIVYDVFEHKNESRIYTFSNWIVDMTTLTEKRPVPELVIGAANDNNTPSPNAINGVKAWQTGDYNLVLIYKNTTTNKTVYKSISLGIDYN